MVAGKLWGGRAGLDFSTAAEVELFSDISTTPPARANLSIPGYLYGAGSSPVLGLGIWDSIDLYFTTGLGLRWQVAGLERHQPWKATIFGGNIMERTVETSVGVDNVINPSSADTTIGGYEFGGSFGYQRNDELLFYTSIVRRWGPGRTVVTQGTGRFIYDESYTMSSIVFGAHYGTTWYFNFEFGTSNIAWRGGPLGTAVASNLGFGYIW